jgi:hypothetical protein
MARQNGNGGVAAPRGRKTHPEGESLEQMRSRVGTTGESETAHVGGPAKKGRGRIKAPIAIVIPQIEIKEFTIEVVGTAPLLVNNFSEKSRKEILDKQMGVAKGKKDKKDPFENFKGSLYILPDKQFPKQKLVKATTDQEWGDYWPYLKDTFGLPAPAFKNAMISSCRYIEDIAMTTVTGAIHVVGFTVPIIYKRLYMREDVVRVGSFPNKVADIRHRGMFTDWSARLNIRYNARMFTPDQIANLLENAGFHVGVCEWRVEKKGQFGTFAIKRG